MLSEISYKCRKAGADSRGNYAQQRTEAKKKLLQALNALQVEIHWEYLSKPLLWKLN